MSFGSIRYRKASHCHYVDVPKGGCITLLITGAPKAGKTTFAKTFGDNVLHTDDLIHLEWSEGSAAVAEWISKPGPWVIEGITIPRALRKYFDLFPDTKPTDELYWLGTPYVPLARGQQQLATANQNIFNQLLPKLLQTGVLIK